jgi:hypothetical protein
MILSHHERGNDHSARGQVLRTEGIQEAGRMTLSCLERGEDHSAKGIQETDEDNSLKS